jgi:hypothetical protein
LKNIKVKVKGITSLTFNQLTTTIVTTRSNAIKWQMGFNLAFKGLKVYFHVSTPVPILWAERELTLSVQKVLAAASWCTFTLTLKYNPSRG